MEKQDVLVEKVSESENEERTYPYIETFIDGNINFKYWVTNNEFELWYKPESWYNSKKLLGFSKVIKPGDRVLNIGCGYGFTNCVIRNLIGSNGILVGVDAVPENCQLSNSHIGLNNYNNCHVINAVASFKEGKAIIWNKSNSAVAYTHTDNPDDTLDVISIKCDNLIKKFGYFDVIVVNVNGYESLALKGCWELLSKKPRLIIKLDDVFLKYNKSSYDDLFKIIIAEDYEGDALLTDIRKFEDFNPDKLLKSKDSAIVYLQPKKSISTSDNIDDNRVINSVEDFLENVAVTGLAEDAVQKKGKYFDETERLWIRYFLNRPFSRKKRLGNISMLHLGRCGSSVLGYLLNQHSKIHWDSELFHFIYDKELVELKMTNDPINLLKIKMSWPLKEYYGFETKFTKEEHLRKELVNMDLLKYLSTLTDIGFNKFIILKRKNYLKQILSLILATKTKNFHTNKEMKEAVKVKINYDNSWFGTLNDSLINIFEYLDRSYAEVENCLYQKDILKLTYEDDILEDPMIALKKVCDFLDIEYNNPVNVFKRTNPFELKDSIENFDELAAHLRNTRFAWMLND